MYEEGVPHLNYVETIWIHDYDDDSNALTGIGVAYEKSRKMVGDTSFAVLDKIAVPLEAIEMDKGAELALTKLNWNLHDSDYLALPIVEKARAERGINDEKIPGSKPTTEPERDSDEIGIIVNGEELKLDVAPQIEGDRVLVPLRAVFEKLGAEVQWDENTDKVKITGADTEIEFSADNTVVTVGDEEKQNDVTARIMNERMLVPMRFPAIELNYNVDRDATNREMRIEMK